MSNHTQNPTSKPTTGSEATPELNRTPEVNKTPATATDVNSRFVTLFDKLCSECNLLLQDNEAAHKQLIPLLEKTLEANEALIKMNGELTAKLDKTTEEVRELRYQLNQLTHGKK